MWAMSKTLEKQEQLPFIRESAHQIWLAGLGALSIAEDESGKIFKTLVKRGRAFEDVAKDRLEEVKGKLDVRKSASDAMERIEDTLDDGMTGVLHRLGLPTMKEIDGLSKRVERLTRTLEEKPRKSRSNGATKRRTAGTHATV
jgi:poly(hydroxyalkanoate) granule-associated protein